MTRPIYSQESDYANDNVGKIAHSKPFWAVIIIAIFIVGYVAYPRVDEPEDVNPNPTPMINTVTDIDGNIYKTIKIGNQTWMAENLKTTKYNDGQEIPQVIGNSAWGSLTTPAYCWLKNDPSNKETYGALYNWYVVETGKLAPKGWHVPTEEDWSKLSNYLGGDSVAGGKMKEGSTSHWFSPNLGATNESGFTAIPSSTRNYDGLIFYRLGDGAYFWSSTEYDDSTAWVRSMLCDSTALKSFNAYKSYGRSVRCVKDSPKLEPAVDTVIDVDGNIYKTIKIGNQTWMAENLRTTKLNDGTQIPYVADASAWENLRTPGYCWYNNDISNKAVYGGIYDWYAVNTGKLAPAGWHVPTKAELTTLINYLGGEDVAGGKLKENGTLHWNSPNTGATNESGFTALPAGYCHGRFLHIGNAGFWWSATLDNAFNQAWRLWMTNDSSKADLNTQHLEVGLSVRCIKN
jgi:uncharacterized protein (TIGR02145 family)